MKRHDGDPSLARWLFLNQRMVFDMVAMLQGGIATVTIPDDARKEVLDQSAAEDLRK